jgi:hypothetical protein
MPPVINYAGMPPTYAQMWGQQAPQLAQAGQAVQTYMQGLDQYAPRSFGAWIDPAAQAAAGKLAEGGMSEAQYLQEKQGLQSDLGRASAGMHRASASTGYYDPRGAAEAAQEKALPAYGVGLSNLAAKKAQMGLQAQENLFGGLASLAQYPAEEAKQSQITYGQLLQQAQMPAVTGIWTGGMRPYGTGMGQVAQAGRGAWWR